MSELDPATRARMEEHIAWLLEGTPTLGDQEVAADIRALLAALDAAVAERDLRLAQLDRTDQQCAKALAERDALKRLAHRDCDHCAADDCEACTGTTDGQRPCYCPHRFAEAARVVAAARAWLSRHSPGTLQALADAVAALPGESHA